LFSRALKPREDPFPAPAPLMPLTLLIESSQIESEGVFCHVFC